MTSEDIAVQEQMRFNGLKKWIFVAGIASKGIQQRRNMSVLTMDYKYEKVRSVRGGKTVAKRVQNQMIYDILESPQT